MKIRYAIVDDNTFLASAIKDKLSMFGEFDLRFCAMDGKQALDKVQQHSHIDLIIMDIEMPVMNGIDATRAIKSRYPHIKIIMLTIFDEDENIFNAIRAGADGYLLKDVDPESLQQGIHDTLNGGAAMNPSIALKTLKLLRNPVDFTSQQESEQVALTGRETQVLQQLSQGLSYTIIAENLILSPSTVRKHIEKIYKKLQVHNKLEAVQTARRKNLI